MAQKVLVTGGTGFIGSHLVDLLAQSGHSVTTLSRQQVLATHGDGVRHLCEDLTDAGVTERLPRDFDVIYHMASTANVRFSVEHPYQDFAANVVGTLHILEYVRRFNPKCKMVLASTVSVVDTSAAKPITEKSPTKPTSPYGASKLAAESYCEAYAATYGVDTRIVRMFNVYGPGIRKLFIHDIYAKLRSNPRQLEMMGDGRQVRDYVYISDVVRLLALVADKGKAGEIYNCTSGTPLELGRLVGMIIDEMGLKNVEIKHLPSYPGDIREWYGEPSKSAALGFRPEIGLKEGLRKTLQSFS